MFDVGFQIVWGAFPEHASDVDFHIVWGAFHEHASDVPAKDNSNTRQQNLTYPDHLNRYF